jgi:hypothetical protein
LARYFDGLDDKIVIADNAGLRITAAITTAAWVYPAELSSESILSKGAATADPDYVFQLLSASVIQFYDGTAWRQSTNPSLALNAWQHVAITWDGTTWRFYKNASPYGTVTSSTAIQSSTAAANIGVQAVDDGNPFKGRIAEVVLLNMALTPNQITQLANGRLVFWPSTSLKGYWPLWGVASPEPDLSGSLNNGTVTGAILTDHAPVGRYVPYRFRVLPATVGVEYINVTDSGLGIDTIVGIEEWLSITDTGVGTESVYLLGEVLIDGLRLDHALRIRVSEPTNVASKPVSSGLPTRIYLGKQGRTLEIEGWVATVAELNVLSALADGAVHEIQLPTGSRVSVHISDVNPVRPIEPGKYPYTLRAVERMD